MGLVHQVLVPVDLVVVVVEELELSDHKQQQAHSVNNQPHPRDRHLGIVGLDQQDYSHLKQVAHQALVHLDLENHHLGIHPALLDLEALDSEALD